MSLRDLGYEYILICPKCGATGSGIKDAPLPLCNVCHQAYMVKTDFDLDTFFSAFTHEECVQMRQRVREQYGIEKLDPECVKIREKYDKDLEEESKHPSSRSKIPPVIECPYCHSADTTKITTVQKAVNTALFGVFGNKRKHQWHCNNCKSDF